MIPLALGLGLWVTAHGLRTAAPGFRARLDASFGPQGGRVVMAAFIGLALVLIIWGYRLAPYIPLWTTPAWLIHVNNLLMLVAVFVFGMSMSKGRTRSWLRHPMLTAVLIWAIAHLLVNGDVASLLMFGCLGAWALVEMAAISTRDGPWTPPAPGTAAGDARLVVITLVAFGLIVVVHTWLGHPPFAA